MIAITGASGLLGNFIVKKFQEQDRLIRALKRSTTKISKEDFSPSVQWQDADVNDSLSLIEAFSNIDTVIHTAATVSFDPRAQKKIFQTNVEGTKNVVNACLACGVSQLIFISSVAALGRKKGLHQIDEEQKWIESNLNSDYAQSKYLGELEAFRGQEEGLSISIINPSVILAPTDPNKSSSQIFKYVNEERFFYADGTINFVDVRDVADAVFGVYEKKIYGEKIIINAGATSLHSLISKIASRLNKKVPTIKVNSILVEIAALLEEFRCRLTGVEMLVSRQSVKMAREKILFKNEKSIRLLGLHYRDLDETLDWCCDYYRKVLT